MTAAWFTALGGSLALTLLAEVGAAFLGGKRRTALAVVALANLLTNPPAVLGLLLWRRANIPWEADWIACAECLAVVVEALVYRAWRERFPHPWRLSLLLNAFSFSVGLLLQWLF